MKGFDPICLEWDGEEYAVPANRQMELLLRVEEGLIKGRPIQAFEVIGSGTVPPLGQLAAVYSDALQYAGAKVSFQEVYNALIASISSDGETVGKVMYSLAAVLNVLASDEPAPKAKGTTEKK